MRNLVVLSVVFSGPLCGCAVTTPAPANSPAGTIGRFQMLGAGSGVYVLDSATGQVWVDDAPGGNVHLESGSPDFYKPKIDAGKK
jgi:hypothetical protein